MAEPSAQANLLSGLHENLWASLRHTFNTDRVLLGVAYLVNFGAFVLLMALLPDKVAASLVALGCLVLLNGLIFLSLRNGQRHAAQTLQALEQIYRDHDLARYFGAEQAAYYRARYRLWLVLQPSLMLLAVAVALAIRYAA